MMGFGACGPKNVLTRSVVLCTSAKAHPSLEELLCDLEGPLGSGVEHRSFPALLVQDKLYHQYGSRGAAVDGVFDDHDDQLYVDG